MTGRHLPGCQYELSSANHQHRESLIHSVEKVPCQDGELCDLPSEVCLETGNFEVT